LAGADDIGVGSLCVRLSFEMGETARLDGLLRGGLSPAGTKIRRGDAGDFADVAVSLYSSRELAQDEAGVGDKGGVATVIEGDRERTFDELASKWEASISRS